MYIENERNPELFWLNTIRNDLKRHNQVLTSFSSILVYYINELNKTYDVIFTDPLVCKSLYELTLSVYSLNPKANDNVANIRLVLANYLDDYNSFLNLQNNKINHKNLSAFSLTTGGTLPLDAIMLKASFSSLLLKILLAFDNLLFLAFSENLAYSSYFSDSSDSVIFMFS